MTDTTEATALLRKAATVLVSAGPALTRATNQSPSERARALNAFLEGTADQTYREIKAYLERAAANEPAPAEAVSGGEHRGSRPADGSPSASQSTRRRYLAQLLDREAAAKALKERYQLRQSVPELMMGLDIALEAGKRSNPTRKPRGD